MKRSERKKIASEKALAKIDKLIRHIRNVQENCILLGQKLIKKGEIELGKSLIANGLMHDASKMRGIEWETLSSESIPNEESAKVKLRYAIYHHASTNHHHPEFFGNIQNMPKVYLAEFVCDVKARSEEFGTSLHKWIDEVATKKFGFEDGDKTHKEIMGFVELLCEKPFEELSK